MSWIKFENNGKGKKYELVVIYDSEVNTKESDSGHLLCFYYLVSWKGYPKEKNI